MSQHFLGFTPKQDIFHSLLDPSILSKVNNITENENYYAICNITCAVLTTSKVFNVRHDMSLWRMFM